LLAGKKVMPFALTEIFFLPVSHFFKAMRQPDFKGDAFVLVLEYMSYVAEYRKHVIWFDNKESNTQLTSIIDSMAHLQELINFEGDITSLQTASEYLSNNN
jgi:hypothetical protein